MPVVDVNTLRPGMYVSFTTIEPHDAVTYYGSIEAIGNYSMTTRYGDMVARYQAMRKINTALAPMDQLLYIVIKIYQDSKISYFIIVKDWIELSSLQIIEQENYFDVRIYTSPIDNLTEVLNLLRTHDFQCSETPKTLL